MPGPEGARGLAATLLQAAAILGMAVIWMMIVHKGWIDISALAARHSGGEFWVELARYFVGNLAGGGKKS